VNSGRDRQNNSNEQTRQREAQRVGISLSYKLRDGLVVAERSSEVAMKDAFPVANVLGAERSVESVGVACLGDLDWRRAFTEDLGDGISRDEMDEQEHDGNDQPDDREGVEDALSQSFQRSVLSCWSALRGLS
jgi:hypothetical protein